MKSQGFGRRDFLKGAVAGAAAATSLPQNAEAQQVAQAAQAAQTLQGVGSIFRR